MAKDEKTGIQTAIDKIHKQFGEGAIRQIGDVPLKIATVSTGSMLLDKAIGVGGYPKGGIIEIYGPESSGKTTLALHCLAEAQKEGLNVAFIDAEHSLDLRYASNIGVRVDKLWLSQPDCGEDALDMVDTLVRSNDMGVIVIDSVAALTPKAEIEGVMGQQHMGLQARLMSQALRKLAGVIGKTNTIVIFINQIRMKIGVMFGSPETTTGGNSLKFYAWVRIDIRRREKIKRGEDIIGNNVKIKVVKNKVGPPFKEVETCIMFGRGVFKEAELLAHHIGEGTVVKAGAWYKYKDKKIQGFDEMTKFIGENLSLFELTT